MQYTPFPGRDTRPLRSRFVPGYAPVVPASGPLEPDNTGEPKEPMPLKIRLASFLERVRRT
tara:strand:+ start:996 stop:1178 length:183 start_codon:yes stop_codon:yes gene_type:complete